MFTEGTTEFNYFVFVIVVLAVLPPVMMLECARRGTAADWANKFRDAPVRVLMEPEIRARVNRLYFRSGLVALGLWVPAIVMAAWLLPVVDPPIWFYIAIPILAIAYGAALRYPHEVINRLQASE